MAKKQQPDQSANDDLASPLETVTSIAVPMTPTLEPGYIGRRIDLEVRGKRGETLKRITDSLMDSGAALEGGRPVRDSRDAICWLLDQAGK